VTIRHVAVEAGKIPASIPMPDSAVRETWTYQIYVRLARPTLDWVGVFAAAYNMGLCDFLQRPVPDATRIIVLAFVAALYGIRTAEKMRGVA